MLFNQGSRQKLLIKRWWGVRRGGREEGRGVNLPRENLPLTLEQTNFIDLTSSPTDLEINN